MSGTMRLRVVTPTGVVLETEAARLVAAAPDGAFGMLPRHVDFVTELVPGVLIHETAAKLHLAQIAELWRRGSVVSSWLLDLTAAALSESDDLAGYSGFVQDSGEGRWTIAAAIEEDVPADVLATSLFARFRSRQEHTFAEKVLSAMRHKFGGHVERAAGG